MQIIPYGDKAKRGLFATRAPQRPHPIGLSCVEVESVHIDHGIITVKGIYLLDGTPVLDIKLYVPQMDAFSDRWGE